MMVSQPAVVCLGVTGRRLGAGLRWPLARLGRWRSATIAEAPAGGSPEDDLGAEAASVAVAEAVQMVLANGGVSGGAAGAMSVAPGDPTRRAGWAAARGIALAATGRDEGATRAFTEALRLDPTLDLALVPGFWDVPRSGQEAAVRACAAVGQSREAAVLDAVLRLIYRPRVVGAAGSTTAAGHLAAAR